MLDPINVLTRMGVDTSNRAHAIRTYREKFEESLTVPQVKEHLDLLTGVPYDFSDLAQAKYTLLYVIDALMNSQEGERNYNQIVFDSFNRASTFLKRSDMQWMFATSSAPKQEGASVQVGEETVTVEKKADGSIKKGGKKTIAMELYKEHVIKNKATKETFVKLLMDATGMTEGGAGTYFYICKKECA